MAQSADTLDSHNVTGAQIHVPNRVVDGHAGTKEGCGLGRLDTVRNRKDGFAAQGRVLGVSAVRDDTVDVFLLAGDKVAAVAARAREAVASVPSRPDELANFPALLRGGDFDNTTDNLVT